MPKSQYLNLKDAALLSGKSAQTIRRLIKGNTVRYRKYKTPQGFSYLVEKTSLTNHYKLNDEPPVEVEEEGELVEEFDPEEETPVVEEVKYAQERPQASRPFHGASPNNNGPSRDASGDFQTVVSQLVQQHREDKKRLFELLEIFQNRILVLEDQIKQLEAPKQKKRRFWLF